MDKVDGIQRVLSAIVKNRKAILRRKFARRGGHRQRQNGRIPFRFRLTAKATHQFPRSSLSRRNHFVGSRREEAEWSALIMTQKGTNMEYEDNPITEETLEDQDGGQEETEDLHEPEADDAGSEAESAEEPGDGGRGRKEQTHEDNSAAKAARIRVERETETRIKKQFDDEIAGSMIPNPYTGKPFKDWAEFREYIEQYHEEQLQERAKTEKRTMAELRREEEDRKLAAQKRRELQEAETQEAAEKAEREFILQDAQDFAKKNPDVDIGKLEKNQRFRKFCGNRFGKEPLAGLYEDYVELVGEAAASAAEKAKSKQERSVGSGAGSGGGGLTAAQQKELDAWNRNNPNMKMTAKEFMER